MDYKIIFGSIAVILGLVGYAPYFKDIFFGQTRPHIFSWLIWSLLEGIAFFAQVSKGAGPGAWITGGTAVLCFGVFIASISKGEKNFTIIDKLSLAGAFLATIFWLLTKQPVAAVILVSLADFLGFVPTFRKAYYNPYGETVKLYGMSAFKSVFAILAVKAYNPTTLIYLISLAFSNTAFVIMSLWRRKVIVQKSS